MQGFDKYDITKEDWRTYVFADGNEYTVLGPVALYIKASDPDSHRVVDSSGTVHYIRKNWLAVQFPEVALEF